MAFAIAALANIVLVFTLLADQPASRGELMFFALPDAAIFLGARAVTYPVSDARSRSVRQQLILGFVLAVAFAATVLSLTLL